MCLSLGAQYACSLAHELVSAGVSHTLTDVRAPVLPQYDKRNGLMLACHEGHLGLARLLLGEEVLAFAILACVQRCIWPIPAVACILAMRHKPSEAH